MIWLLRIVCLDLLNRFLPVPLITLSWLMSWLIGSRNLVFCIIWSASKEAISGPSFERIEPNLTEESSLCHNLLSMGQCYGRDSTQAFTIYDAIFSFRIPDAARRMARTSCSCPKCFEPHEIISSRWFCFHDNIHEIMLISILEKCHQNDSIVNQSNHAHFHEWRQKLD